MTNTIKAQITDLSSTPQFSDCVGEVFSVLGLYEKFDNSKYAVFPGFCDVHVHFREPGFSYKEDIASGTLAAAHGGYTDVCTMPNLIPVPDSSENLKIQEEAIKKNALINVHPYASITKGEKGIELCDMEVLKDRCIAFSDDGKGVQSEELMREAMTKAKQLGKIIAAHCEDNSLLNGGYIHKGTYALQHNHMGICSESEYKQIERDLKLVSEIGCKYHVCHISTKESVELIRQAKRNGLDVSCETGPHYLVLDDSDLRESGEYKMNPPLRSKADREALTEGILDGTIDMIATDHAPHSKEEKSKGLKDSLFGIVGLETAFPVLYTYLVKTGITDLNKIMELMVYNPRKRFNIPLGNDFSVWDLSKEYTVNPDSFFSKGKATPFTEHILTGECMLTWCNGKIVYNHSDI